MRGDLPFHIPIDPTIPARFQTRRSVPSTDLKANLPDAFEQILPQADHKGSPTDKDLPHCHTTTRAPPGHAHKYNGSCERLDIPCHHVHKNNWQTERSIIAQQSECNHDTKKLSIPHDNQTNIDNQYSPQKQKMKSICRSSEINLHYGTWQKRLVNHRMRNTLWL